MKRSLFFAMISCSALASVQLGCQSSKPASDPNAKSGQPQQAEAAPVAQTPARPTAVNAGTCPSSELIDDFEDGDHRSILIDERGGYWYTYRDPSSTVSPEGTFTAQEGGANESSYSGRMSGSVGSQQYPYVGIGVAFTDPKAAYDVSCCEGISFWGKKNGDGISQVRFKVGDWQTDPAGGSCKQCYNDFGGDFVFTDEWKEYSISFADMRQEPYWGEPKTAIDKSAVYQLQWQVKQGNSPFDIQVDNIKLTGCSSGG